MSRALLRTSLCQSRALRWVSGALLRTSLRYYLRRRWQTLLALAGIALGVAVMVAVDIANASARRAFGLTLDRIAGRATHQIETLGGPIPEDLYRKLAVELGIARATPILEATVRLGGEAFTLLGMDALSQRPFRDQVWDIPSTDRAALLTEPGGLLLSQIDAERLGRHPGETLALEVAGRARPVRLVGLLRAEDPGSAAGLLVTDIATAQEILDRLGELDRIDLILTAEQEQRVESALPPGLRLSPASRRGASLTRMTESFHLNLAAMGLLAVLVGGFIIYNTLTFAVLQRRPLLGTLRTLGVTRGQIFALVMAEALVLGSLGILLGLGLGTLTGRGLVVLVTRTINDLYFTVTVTRFFLEPWPLVKGSAVGLGVALLAAAVPAFEAARSEPHDTLRRGLIERRSGRLLPWLARVGVLLLIAGLALAAVPSPSLILGFVALFLVVIGYCLAVPQLLVALCRLLGGSIATRLSFQARLALRGVSGTISRTGVAVAALTLAVAASLGVGIMVGSFRGSVADWIGATLRSDLYVSAPSRLSNRTEGALPEGLPERIRALPGVAEISTGRTSRGETSLGPVSLLAIDPSSRSHRGFQFKGDALHDLWGRFRRGEVLLVSEPYAYRHNLAAGDPLVLLTPQGPRAFNIGGVFYDYGSDSGMLVISRGLYQALWEDPAVSTVGVALADPGESPRVEAALRALVAPLDQAVRVRSNQRIREDSMAVFDRTFTVTRVLRLLAIGVAFLGVLNALLALQMERARDYAVLRATGMTPRSLAGLVIRQTGLLGGAAALFALPLGVLMAALLIEVVNRRAFGWTIQLALEPSPLLGALALAVVAALLAGLYPAWRAAQSEPALALRDP